MTHSSIPPHAAFPRASDDAGESRDVATPKTPVAARTESWIVQQEFEDDEAVNRETGGSERDRIRSFWLD